MIEALAITGMILAVAILAFLDIQLRDRRKKAQKKWERRQDLAEQRLELEFDQPDDEGDDESESSTPTEILPAGPDSPVRCGVCGDGAKTHARVKVAGEPIAVCSYVCKKKAMDSGREVVAE